MRNVLISILIMLIGWDILTTYYGTLSVFAEGNAAVWDKVKSTDFVVHLVAMVFSIGLIVFILAYRIILNSKNKITMGILGVAFMYDFATSFYGTFQAVSPREGNIPAVAIVFLLSIMCTSAPLLIGQIYEDSEE